MRNICQVDMFYILIFRVQCNVICILIWYRFCQRIYNQGASAVVLFDAIFDKDAISQNNFNEIFRLAHFATLQGNEAVEW